MSKANQKTTEKIRSFPEILESYEAIIRPSEMFSELCKTLDIYKENINKIRCLAIGSFTEDFQAGYQLALLLELVKYLDKNDKSVHVSIYDPVFNNQDKQYIKDNVKGWTIEENMDETNLDSASTLFFLPHAPLDLTEDILKNEKPRYLLANNVIQHTDRYTKAQLYEKYPILGKLVHFSEKKFRETKSPTNTDDNTNDDFTTFLSKKKRNRNSKSKYKLVEAKIDYDSIITNFSDCQILTTFENGKMLKDMPWINSFSDLSMHLIS